MKFARILALSTLALAALTGCATDAPPPIAAPPPASVPPTPTPTATPTKPALDDLVLSTDGLGSIVMGEAPVVSDPALDILIYDEDHCQEFVDDGRLDDAGKWIANYEPALSGASFEPFSVWVKNDIVSIIAIGSREILTAEGLGLGSSRADVVAAYPDAEITHGFGTDIYVVESEYARLVFEVGTEQITGSVDEDVYPVDKVGGLRVVDVSMQAVTWANTEGGTFANCLAA